MVGELAAARRAHDVDPLRAPVVLAEGQVARLRAAAERVDGRVLEEQQQRRQPAGEHPLAQRLLQRGGLAVLDGPEVAGPRSTAWRSWYARLGRRAGSSVGDVATRAGEVLAQPRRRCRSRRARRRPRPPGRCPRAAAAPPRRGARSATAAASRPSRPRSGGRTSAGCSRRGAPSPSTVSGSASRCLHPARVADEVAARRGGQRALDELRLAAVAVRGDHHPPRDRVRRLGAVVAPDHVQAEVDARPRRRPT